MSWWEFLLVAMLVLPITVLWIGTIIDIIGRPDLKGWAKALWMLGVLVFPIFGSLIYVVRRPPVLLTTPAPPPNTRDDAWSRTDSYPGVGL